MTEDTAVRWLHPTRTGGLSVLKSPSYDGLVSRNGIFMGPTAVRGTRRNGKPQGPANVQTTTTGASVVKPEW